MEGIQLNISKVKNILAKVKKIITRIDSYKFVKKSLKNKNVPKLTKEEKNKIQSYWKHYYSFINYNWYRYFKFVNKKFDEKYITEDFFFNDIIPKLNNVNLTKAYVDKNYFDKHYSKIKMPKVILRNINGNFYDQNYNYLNENQILEIIDKLSGTFIIKPALETGGGRNVKKIIVNNSRIEIKGKYIELKNLFDEYECDFLIQECIEQSSFLSSLFPKSVNTMRIITYREKQDVTILAGSLRVGRADAEVDNMSSGGIAIGIDVETGRINNFGITENLEFIEERHPDTGMKFGNEIIPNWSRVKDSLKIWFNEIPPYFNLVSWDITLDKNNEPIFIEINLRYQGIELGQLNGPLFGDKTDIILKKILGNSL